MHDTTPLVARKMRDAWLELPPERRLLLAAGMFDGARAMALASFPDGLSAEELKVRLCERLYGERLALHYRLALRDRTGAEVE